MAARVRYEYFENIYNILAFVSGEKKEKTYSGREMSVERCLPLNWRRSWYLVARECHRDSRIWCLFHMICQPHNPGTCQGGGEGGHFRQDCILAPASDPLSLLTNAFSGGNPGICLPLSRRGCVKSGP